MDTRLGKLLVHKGIITPEQLQKAIEEQRQHGGLLSVHLVKLGCFTEDELLAYVQKEYRLPTTDLRGLEIPDEVIQLIPHALVTKYLFVPIAQSSSTLTLAMADPSNPVAVEEVKFLTGADVKIVLTTISSIQWAIERFYDRAMKYDQVLNDLRGQDVEVVKDQGEIDLQELERATEDAPVVRCYRPRGFTTCSTNLPVGAWPTISPFSITNAPRRKVITGTPFTLRPSHSE